MPTSTPLEPAVQASGIIKSYGGVAVLRGVDLTVADGAAFGLVGVNGAGKTTLIKCMLDFCSVDSGVFRIYGVSHTVTAARERIAFVPENFVPPHYLTCYEFIELASALAGSRFRSNRVELMFDELRLDRAALRRPVRQLSKGMTQKLGLAGCLLVDRDLYLLDEPMSGLDPASRVAVKAVLARLTREGRTLFFTSHVLSDVEELCSSIAVLDRGEIRFQGSPKQLCERYSEANLERAFMRSIHVAEPSNAH
ncbi:MAG TPA: ABC transporter ATP-binding protein [Pyrinomonadaceae bacterium]|nr:ABC transporter ATP-binding protein [Pyrinomonadaceae bacterium]